MDLDLDEACMERGREKVTVPRLILMVLLPQTKDLSSVLLLPIPFAACRCHMDTKIDFCRF